MEQLHHHQFPTTTDVHPTPVANATPTHSHSSNHPSYAEMITAAILWDGSQGKAGGSSKRAISKYIDRVYTNLPPTHPALLTHHLKRMKNSGQLVMIKNSYQLPVVAAATTVHNNNTSTASPVPLRSAPPLPDSTPKKSPGRPRNPKSESQPTSAVNGKRPRGRPPRKQQPVVAEVPFVQTQSPPNYASDLGLNDYGQPAKRRPGRPSKKQAQFQGAMVVYSPAHGTDVKKRPGRPPKSANVSGGPKQRGRPKRNGLGPVAKRIGKKPRGRPPRQPGVGPGSGVAGGKRRGRPPKGSVVPPSKAVKKPYTGKPRGRPKKSASTPGKPTPEHRIADEGLIKKVENMQAKIRDTVGILKPYFLNENTTDEALTALQQLEDLATVEPPVTAMPLNNATIQPCTDAPSEVVITIPAPQAAQPPPVVPFSISAPAMTEAVPFYDASEHWNSTAN